MILLSFDIGIQNLGYCEIEVNDGKAGENLDKIVPKTWKVATLREKNEKVEFDETMRRLFNFLKETWPYSSPMPSLVLIENQPCLKNPAMKSIQIAIYSYFSLAPSFSSNSSSSSPLSNFTKVQLMSASNKLKVKKNTTPVNKKTSYAEKKKLAIVLARTYILETGREDLRLFFEKSPKKDDLSDAYLQAVYYLELRTAAA